MKNIPIDGSPECIRASLEFEEKIQRYMFNKYGPDHLLMEMMFELRRDLRLFPEGCRVSVNIPVAGHQESANIYRTLFSYSEQGEHLVDYAGWDTFEINLFVNTPEPTSENSYNWDTTLDEIQRFTDDFPHIHINVLKRRLHESLLDIGIIRGILTDVHFLRIGAHPDHVIISNDADQVAIHPQYIKKIIEKFDDPDVQIFGGKVEEDPITYLNHPDFFVGERFIDLHIGSVFNTPGANSAFRSSAYISVGGYFPIDGKCGEDTDLGARIADRSWGNKDRGYYEGRGRALRVVTSGRRMVALLMQHGKIPGRHAWQEVYEDGSSGMVDFGPDDAYRNLQIYPDTRKLSSILQDDDSWREFLKTIAPHLFKKIGFHTVDSVSVEFASVENLAQILYGTDEEKKSQITKVFCKEIQVAEYNPQENQLLFEQSPLKVAFPLSRFPDNTRRAFVFLGVEDIRCVVHFFPDPMHVLVDFEITRADKMRAGLQKFLDKMKAQHQI